MLDEGLSLSELKEKVSVGFEERFGISPTHFVSSPGRLNVIGEHVDYSGGIVLPAAIERWIAGCFRSNNEGQVRIYDLRFEDYAEFDPNAELQPEKGSWLNYPKGVFAQFQKRSETIPGFDLCMFSNVPTGGGLSSSAALEALFATVVESLNGTEMDPMEKALLCQKAEHEFAGVPCGIMDQAAVILSKEQHLLRLDCRDLSVAEVPFGSVDLGLMIIDSGVHHELADGEYAKRRADCEAACAEMGISLLREVSLQEVSEYYFTEDRIKDRAIHVTSEIERTQKLVSSLERSNFTEAGRLIQQSHHSLQFLFDVSCKELDFIVGLANGLEGVYGARMMGGGFGGSAIVLVEKNHAQSVAEIVSTKYQQHFKIEPSIFLTNPTEGVSVKSL